MLGPAFYRAFDFDNGPGTVMSKPLEGGTIVVYAGPNPNPLGIASDGSYVYFTNLGAGATLAQRTNGSVMACPVGGCSAAGPMVLASGQHNANAIALDADAVYFTTAGLGSNDGTVMKVAKP